MVLKNKLPNFVEHPLSYTPLNGWEYWLKHLDLTDIQCKKDWYSYCTAIRYALTRIGVDLSA